MIVIVVLGGGYLLVSKPNPKNDSAEIATTQGNYATVGDATESGKSLKCTYARAGAGYNASATYYFLDGKIRIELMAQNTTSFMILTDSALHTWNDLTEKPRVTTLNLSGSGATSEAVVTSLMRTPLSEFTCQETNVDASLFTPPAQ